MRAPERAVFDHGQPIWRPNLAPLAGIWLVCAALAASTYGTPTHAVVIDLPAPSPMPGIEDEQLAGEIVQVGLGADGRALWNGRTVGDEEFARLATELRDQPITPLILFEPAPNASYERSLQIMAILSQRGLTQSRFCFGGIHLHRQFGSLNFPAHGAPMLASIAIPPPPAPPNRPVIASEPLPLLEHECIRAWRLAAEGRLS